VKKSSSVPPLVLLLVLEESVVVDEEEEEEDKVGLRRSGSGEELEIMGVGMILFEEGWRLEGSRGGLLEVEDDRLEESKELSRDGDKF